MTTCLETMATAIIITGVDPNAYAAFVAGTVNGLDPGNSIIGATYSNTVTSVTSGVALATILVILLVFILLIVMVYHEGYISDVSLVSAIAMSFAISALYYILLRSYSLSLAYDLLPVFQQTAVASALYTVNSAIRDTIYLALCR